MLGCTLASSQAHQIIAHHHHHHAKMEFLKTSLRDGGWREWCDIYRRQTVTAIWTQKLSNFTIICQKKMSVYIITKPDSRNRIFCILRFYRSTLNEMLFWRLFISLTYVCDNCSESTRETSARTRTKSAVYHLIQCTLAYVAPVAPKSVVCRSLHSSSLTV